MGDEHAPPLGEADDLWTFGAQVSQAMTERVAALYRDLGSAASRAGGRDLDAELTEVRLDLERLADLSFEVLDRFLAVVRRVASEDRPRADASSEVVALRGEVGATTSVDLWLHNVSTDEHPPPTLHLATLTNVSGDHIDPSCITVSAAATPIDGGHSRRVTVGVDVPMRTPTGTYHGVLVADGVAEQTMLVRLEVVASGTANGKDASTP